MRLIPPGLVALLAVGLSSSFTTAGGCCYPCYPGIPKAPDACGPGYYAVNQYGALYGPNYCLLPPCLPFNGLLPLLTQYGEYTPAFVSHPQAFPQRPAQAFPQSPAQAGLPATLAFPTHPFARSPRDFFMIGQNTQD